MLYLSIFALLYNFIFLNCDIDNNKISHKLRRKNLEIILIFTKLLSIFIMLTYE